MKGAWIPAQADLFTASQTDALTVEPDFRPPLPTWAGVQGLGSVLTSDDYQAVGSCWLARHRRGMFHDAYGLGKTKQFIDAVSYVATHEGPQDVLLLTLAGGLDTLAAEIARFAPGAAVFMYRGPDRYRKFTEWKPAKRNANVFVLASYAVFRSDYDVLSSIEWTWAACDEGDAIRSSPLNEDQQSQVSQLIHRLQPPRRHIITATPIVAGIHDLYNQFKWLGLEDRSWVEFERETLVTKIHKITEYTTRRRVSREKPFGEQKMRVTFALHALGRTEKEAGVSLPPMIHKVHRVPMSKHHAAEYKALERESEYTLDRIFDPHTNATWGPHYQVMRKLRQQLAFAVVPYAAELADEIVATGAKVVIFSQWRDVLEALEGKFTNYAMVHGDVSLTANALGESLRTREVNRFLEDPNVNVMLATVQTMQRMFTLTAATHMIFTDKQEWSAASTAQALRRIKRIGQTKTTYAHTLHAVYPDGTATLAEKIEKSIGENENLASRIEHGRATPRDFLELLKR